MATITDSRSSLTVQIVPESNAGNILISRKDLAENFLEFRTCEGVLRGNSDFGLFRMKLTEDDWHKQQNVFGYSWNYDTELRVDFSATLLFDSISLSYTVTNNSKHQLKRVQIHPCIPTTDAPVFRPHRDVPPYDFQPLYFDRRGPAMCTCDNTYFELYERISLWRDGRRFTFADTSHGSNEVHLSIMRKEESPVEWAWWNNADETFDTSLITISSHNGQYTIGLSFDSAIWASSNVGDERACFHLFPFFGDLSPGASKSVQGECYFILGSPEDLLARIRTVP